MLKVDDLSVLVDVLHTHPRVLIDFSAPSWCVPCQRLTPHFHAASEKSDVLFVEVDIDTAPEIADVYNVMSVPTLRLYEDGEFVRDLPARTAVTILNELQ